MSKFIFYEDCDITLMDKRPKFVNGNWTFVEEKVHISKQLKCSHPMVEKIWTYAMMHPANNNLVAITSLLFNNGERKEFKYIGEDFTEAENYLKSLT